MKYFAFVFLLLILPAGFSSAQLGSLGQGLDITLEPRLPSPNTKATASLDDYSLAGQVSNIDWYINGKRIPESTNQRSIEFQTGEMGTKIDIEAIIKINGQGKRVLNHTVNPLYLDIIVEPQTRVPSFYKGRSLPSVSSEVNYTALLNGGAISPNNLIYKWKIDDQVIDGGGLRGKYKVAAPTSRWGDSLLSLTVSDLNGNTLATKDIQITSVEPEILFYESNTLYGINQLPITGSLNLIGDSATINAEPYHLDILTYNRPPLLEWKIDGSRNPNNSSNPYEITLARQGGQGQSTVDFHVRNLTEFLQGGESSFNVNF